MAAREQSGPASSEPIPGLDAVLSAEGWPYASAAALGAGGPGRFHALFGRDAAIASLQVLPARPDVARATLRKLAALQGTRDDPRTDEEPGKIVHEWWPRTPAHLVGGGWPVDQDGELRYYGSADSTSWFLVLLAAADEGTLAAELEDAWRAAGRWLERTLDRGGGLVRHGPRRAPGGLAQQGWRDAIDPADPASHGGGILRADGDAPSAPLADLDTQAVATVGLRSLAVLSEEGHWRDAAAKLAGRIDAEFDPEAIALEPDGSKVSGAGSQLGWLLWADALSPSRRERAVERLVQPDLLTPWGLRTLSAEHRHFAPDAYHRGAVWPFDSWLGWGGLRAAGAAKAAEGLRRGILEAIDALGGFPELLAVGSKGPAPIPIANRVQAWTVGARWALEHEWDGRAESVFDL